MDLATNTNGLRKREIWIGIAVGTAIGIGIALSRRKKSRWDAARAVTKRVAGRSGELAEATMGIVGRVKTIYEDGLKVVEDAGALWAHGRKMASH